MTDPYTSPHSGACDDHHLVLTVQTIKEATKNEFVSCFRWCQSTTKVFSVRYMYSVVRVETPQQTSTPHAKRKTASYNSSTPLQVCMGVCAETAIFQKEERLHIEYYTCSCRS